MSFFIRTVIIEIEREENPRFCLQKKVNRMSLPKMNILGKNDIEGKIAISVLNMQTLRYLRYIQVDVSSKLL